MDNGYSFKIYNDSAARTGLKGYALLVYSAIFDKTAKSNEFVVFTTRELSDWTGASSKTVFRALKELVSKGLVEKTTVIRPDTNNLFCAYRVTDTRSV